MKKALVIGASGGIGAAVADALHARGFEVTGLSRGSHGLDFRAPDTVDLQLSGIDEVFECVFVATGVLDGAGQPPEKMLRHVTPDAMADQVLVNCIGPAMVLRHLSRLMPRDRLSYCGVLSARVGSIGDNGLGGWYSYRAAKAALNQTVHGAAIEIARTHPKAVLACLHPGTVATPFTRAFPRQKLTPRDSAQGLVETLLARIPAESGGFWDWRGQPVPW